jgi:hypothetical protein
MFAPRRSPAGRSERQNPKFKDVVFCEGSPFPLAVPGVLIATIWDQVNEGLRAVPRGGAEVGGLILGRRIQPATILAEAVVPISIEYHFGPSFRLSPSDLKGIEALMASLQKDPSQAVVGFYRSRTRNDSLSEESESAVLATLEQAHTSFASDFHYYVAFTPASRSTMTASVSFRKEEGWDDWQHVMLVMNLRPAAQPIEFPPPKATHAPGPQFEQPPLRTAPAPPPESQPLPVEDRRPEPEPALPDAAALALQPAAEPPARSHADWLLAEPPADRPPEGKGGARVLWYAAGAVLLAAVTLGTYQWISPAQKRVTLSEIHSAPLPAPAPASAPPPAPAPEVVRTQFAATRDGALWKLTWDPAAVEALHPTSAALSISDGAKKQQVDLTPSDLRNGKIFYTPESNNLIFTLNIAVPGGQSVEEHVRVLEGPRKAEAPAEPAATIVVADNARTLRPFTPAPNLPKDSSVGNSAIAEAPPPLVLATASNQPFSPVLPIAPAAPAPLVSASVSKPPSPTETSAAPARVDLPKQFVGTWAATFSESPFPTESASVSLTVYMGEVTGWFLGKYKILRNVPLKEPVSFQFQGSLEKDRLPDGAWVFPFKSVDGWQGTIKLRPQGNALDVTWKASLADGKAYTFEHVMGRPAAK